MTTAPSNALDCYQGLKPAQAGQSARTAGSERGWAVYAAAGSALAMSGAADADIIYSGVQNVTVEQGGTTFAGIDVDGGGDDMTIVVNNFGFAMAYGANGAQIPYSGTSYWARRFGSGSTIGSGADFNSSTKFIRATNVKGSTFGNWKLSSNGIAGFQLGSGNFGWIRLHAENTGGLVDKLTAIDWAYEDSGATIAAGATGSSGVPVPPSLALLATGAIGVAAMRRRRRARGRKPAGDNGEAAA